MPRGRWYLNERPTRWTSLAISAEASVSPSRAVYFLPSKEKRTGLPERRPLPGMRLGAVIGRASRRLALYGACTMARLVLYGAPLCPAGHLPHEGGDWLSLRVSPIADVEGWRNASGR